MGESRESVVERLRDTVTSHSLVGRKHLTTRTGDVEALLAVVEALEQACDDIETMMKAVSGTLMALEAERNVKHYRQALAALTTEQKP